MLAPNNGKFRRLPCRRVSLTSTELAGVPVTFQPLSTTFDRFHDRLERLEALMSGHVRVGPGRFVSQT